jgi:hypothetical protein
LRLPQRANPETAAALNRLNAKPPRRKEAPSERKKIAQGNALGTAIQKPFKPRRGNGA